MSRAEKRSQWSERLRRFAQSNLSVVEFCRREQVSVPSFYQWRKKLARSAKPPQDVPLPSKTAFLPVQVAVGARLQAAFPNGATLSLAADDHELVKLSIQVIAEAQTAAGEA